MRFEWDDNKNQINLAKHGISFAGAAIIFLDPDRLEWRDDRKNYGETRYITVGNANDVILYVVYTLRDDIYRLISTRKAKKDEREMYLYDR